MYVVGTGSIDEGSEEWLGLAYTAKTLPPDSPGKRPEGAQTRGPCRALSRSYAYRNSYMPEKRLGRWPDSQGSAHGKGRAPVGRRRQLSLTGLLGLRDATLGPYASNESWDMVTAWTPARAGQGPLGRGVVFLKPCPHCRSQGGQAIMHRPSTYRLRKHTDRIQDPWSNSGAM